MKFGSFESLTYMVDQDLINKLVERGKLEQKVAEEIMKRAKLIGRPAEDLIYERRIVPEEEVAKVKSELTGAPYRKVEADKIDEKLLKAIPKETSMNYRIAPIERTEDMLVVGMVRPDDEKAKEVLKFIAKREGVNLGVYLITPTDLAAVWRKYAPYRGEVEQALREIGEVAKGEGEDIISLEEGGTAEEAPVIKIVASTLRQAVELSASDIHIEPQRSYLRIRFRLDGELKEMVTLPASLAQSVVSRIKVLARLKLDETRVPQDGRFRSVVLGRDIDYRVSTFPTPNGEKVAIRVLDPATGLKGLEHLGLNKLHTEVLKEATERPYGMILASGPTGSGKTTTLYAIMKELNKEAVNVMTLEDPVEYFMEGVNQSHVRPEIGYTFASGLRQILRQDPDIIMVGEVRDTETADLAVNSALTGHVMLSTIHTNNAVGVIPRLTDLGVPPFLLSSALNLMVAQRLVLRLCPKCKKETQASGKVEAMIKETLQKLPAVLKKEKNFAPPYKLHGAEPKPDCEICHGKGTSGRIALFEMFKMTRELGDLVNAGFTEGKLWDEAERQGIITLKQDGVLKALDGTVSMEEVLRETT